MIYSFGRGHTTLPESLKGSGPLQSFLFVFDSVLGPVPDRGRCPEWFGFFDTTRPRRVLFIHWRRFLYVSRSRSSVSFHVTRPPFCLRGRGEGVCPVFRTRSRLLGILIVSRIKPLEDDGLSFTFFIIFIFIFVYRRFLDLFFGGPWVRVRRTESHEDVDCCRCWF